MALSECQQEEQPILAFAKAVIRNTAIMIAKWQTGRFCSWCDEYR